MPSLRWLDVAVVVAYLLGLTLLGLRFARRQTSTETYFVAKRSIPPWAMGFSILATLITSVTFIAYPGAAYAKNWSLLVPGFMVVVILALVGLVIIPFYRQEVRMSAYEYFGQRFGQPTRVYTSIAFAAGHFSKMGFVLYLVALTVNSMTGWNTEQIIIIVGALTILYTLAGGLEAVIWTDFVQGIILWVGIVVCLCFLLVESPGGPAAVFRVAADNHKFSLGSTDWDFSTQTIPVLIIYGFFWYLQKFTADQTVVQRYLVAKTDRGALTGVGLGALLCIPVWSLFMLIGTCTWAFYKLTGEKLPAYITKSDQVFPHFLTTHLPPGVAGVIMAALIGAAMCALASDLNSLSSVGVADIYRMIRPGATDRERLRMGKYIVAGCGIACILTALVLGQMKGSALSMWFTVSAVASGGLAGLWALAFLTSRASRRGVYVGIVLMLLFTAWSSMTLSDKRLIDLGVWNFRWHDYMIGAIGHVILFVFGYAASLLLPDRETAEHLRGTTIWNWLRSRREHLLESAASTPVV
jgi:SSS family solute:Na+ symporter